METTTPIHLIGIGGAGMSAIARLLLESGFSVSGSDRTLSSLTRGLQEAGAQVFEGHRPENIRGAGLMVRSSAVRDDNPEVMAARATGIPVLKRADFLGELMLGRTGIAVAGSHGKTTTTAMIAWMLTALGQDPSYIIGGVSINLSANAHAGSGAAFVIEADEYDRMFLGLQPTIAVVTNVEHDHPDCYPTPEDFYQAFLAFTGKLAADGVLVACSDDPGAARLLREAAQRGTDCKSYGLAGVDYQAQNLALNEYGGYDFDALFPGVSLSPVHCSLRVPGRHNVWNALAALAVAALLRLPLDEAAQALGKYLGSGRRFEVRGEAGGVVVIDDYAHHPTHIRATLSAARSRYPGRRIWAVWQPHTYTRTMALLQAYANAFGEADCVIVTEVYPARELVPPGGFSAAQVVALMQTNGPRSPQVSFIPGMQQTGDVLLSELKAGDVVLVLSAGDADQVSARVLAGLASEAAPKKQVSAGPSRAAPGKNG